jgi:hypothetical protein
LGAVVVIASGCATVTRGTKEAFVVETIPSGAEVQLSNGLSCEMTPCSLKVPRKGAFVATITKPGYETVRVNVETQVSGGGSAGMAGNVLLGGIIGAGVDAGTGAMLEHKPNPLQVTLEKLEE